MRSNKTSSSRPTAVLVGLQLPDMSDAEFEASMAELGRLTHTLGFDVIATLGQKRASAVTGTVVGEGKLREIASWTGGSGKIEPTTTKKPSKAREKASLLDPKPLPMDLHDSHERPSGKADKVVFDCDLTPSQLRNLTSATGAEVLDRTGVIVEIFYRHAKTREAKLQVEIARLRYLSPRIRATGPSDRQGGGIGAKGVGETAHELDRRRTRDRVAELQRELALIHADQGQRRARRRDQSRVALVGYTNAGKSSIMRALTGSAVLVADKLFATLDTTVRALHPETNPRVLVSDTVGFIKKLPHDLVASFRSTLDEAADASLLLLVVDASDPTFRSHLDVVRGVLGEIDAADVPTHVVLNKIDQVDAPTRRALKKEFPDATQMSALAKSDIAALRDQIVSRFEVGMRETNLTVPYAANGIIGEIRREARVISETYEEDGVVIRVRATPETIARLKKLLKSKHGGTRKCVRASR